MDYLIDKINIKDLPEEISHFFKKNSVKEYNNLRIFYTRLLEEVSEDVKLSYLNRVLKYLSSDSSSVINIIEDFNEGVYDSELKLFCKKLVSKINKYNGYLELYETLNKQVISVFFDKDDYLLAKNSHNEEDYELFLFILIKHMFKCYQTNIPGIVCKRFYEEALTLAYNTKHRSLMLKSSADLGNADAAILYADYMYDKDIDEAMMYFYKAKSKVPALWEIGFALEHNMLKKETVQFLLKEMPEYFLSDELIEKISVSEFGKNKTDEKTLLLAVKIYSYIVKKHEFTKAINSIGKLLIFDYILYDNSREKSVKIAKDYLKRAIKLGNLNAMTNLSVYFTNNPDDSEYDYELMKRLFRFSADLGDVEACYYYGKILLDEEKDKQALTYLKYAEERNEKNACFILGKYYELNQDYKEAIKCYQKALSKRYYDAAYSLALLYFKLNELYDDFDIEYKEIAKELLNDNIDKLSDDIKVKAKSLLDKLK